MIVSSECMCVHQMLSQMRQLQSQQEQEREKMEQFADTVDSSVAEPSSSSDQLLDVVR